MYKKEAQRSPFILSLSAFLLEGGKGENPVSVARTRFCLKAEIGDQRGFNWRNMSDKRNMLHLIEQVDAEGLKFTIA